MQDSGSSRSEFGCLLFRLEQLSKSYADHLSSCRFVSFFSLRRRIKEDLHPSSTEVFSSNLKRARPRRLDLRTEVTQGKTRARRDRALLLEGVEAGGRRSGVEPTRGGMRGEKIVGIRFRPSSHSALSLSS